MTLAALPRSSLHVALLEANLPEIDHVLYRDQRLATEIERLWPGKTEYLGREGRLPFTIVGAVRQFRENRQYYQAVRERIVSLKVDRLILFLENEPLEASIVDWFPGKLELWEDGLSHYVDLTSSLWYAGRGAVQIVSGYYPRGAMLRRADRRRFTIRDRFQEGGLSLPVPQRVPPEDAVCFIGSPLVEDGLVRRKVLAQGLARIAGVSPFPLFYLPHPRENLAELEAMLANIAGVAMAPEPFGVFKHAERHGYRAFIAPVSTALLDLGAFSDSLFVPALFGENRMHVALAGWAYNPVSLAASVEEVGQFLRSKVAMV